jgi:hypothetical protein
MGEQCIPYLERFNAILGKLADALLPIILLLLGLALISDAVLFFWTGDGLI